MTQTYKTQDIVLASCLKMSGYTLQAIELVGAKGIFIFENIPDQFLQDYDLGKTTVEPVLFNNNIKQLTTAVRRLIPKN